MDKKKKHKNNDEDPRIFRYYPIIAIFAIAFFGVSLGVGLSKDIDWLVTLGIVVLAVTIAVMSLSRTIWFFWTVATVMKEKDEEEERERAGKPSPEDEYKQFSAYRDYDEEEATESDSGDVKPEKAKERKASSYDYEATQNPKYWSRSDKVKVYSVVFPLVITLLVFMAGIFISNIGILSVGYPLMGAGGGGFALVIVILIIVGVVQDKRRK